MNEGQFVLAFIGGFIVLCLAINEQCAAAIHWLAVKLVRWPVGG